MTAQRVDWPKEIRRELLWASGHLSWVELAQRLMDRNAGGSGPLRFQQYYGSVRNATHPSESDFYVLRGEGLIRVTLPEFLRDDLPLQDPEPGQQVECWDNTFGRWFRATLVRVEPREQVAPSMRGRVWWWVRCEPSVFTSGTTVVPAHRIYKPRGGSMMYRLYLVKVAVGTPEMGEVNFVVRADNPEEAMVLAERYMKLNGYPSPRTFVLVEDLKATLLEATYRAPDASPR